MKLKTLKEIAVHDAIYFAGFFDGEGCVGIYLRPIKHSGRGAVSPQYFLSISIANTNFEVLSHIRETCGGVIGNPQIHRPKKDGNPRKHLWRWSAQSRESFHILSAVFPFLIVKREQAAVALEYQTTILEYANRPHPGRLGQNRLEPEEIKRRREFALHMKALKSRKSSYAPTTATAPLS